MTCAHVRTDEVEWAIGAARLDLEDEPFDFSRLKRGMEAELRFGPRHARLERTRAVSLAAALIAVSRLREDEDYYDRVAHASAVTEAASALAIEPGYGVVHHRPVSRRRQGV